MKKIGFIDYYLHEWHADNYPKWISDYSGGQMQVSYAWGEIDSPNAGAKTNKTWCEENGVKLCASIDEVISSSDYIVVLSPDNPERHMDLCKLPLVSGKRVYVDKTFAVCKADAEFMIDYAKKNNTPFFTSSALRYAPEYRNYPKNNIESIDSRGPGKFLGYGIHQVEPLVFLMGGCAHRVICSGGADAANPTFIFEYKDGRRAVTHHFVGDIGFGMIIYNKDGKSADLKIESDFFKHFIKDMIRFFETGEPSFEFSQTIAVAAMLEAGEKAMARPGEWVEV